MTDDGKRRNNAIEAIIEGVAVRRKTHEPDLKLKHEGGFALS
jgi:hypothetical protein